MSQNEESLFTDPINSSEQIPDFFFAQQILENKPVTEK